MWANQGFSQILKIHKATPIHDIGDNPCLRVCNSATEWPIASQMMCVFIFYIHDGIS